MIKTVWEVWKLLKFVKLDLKRFEVTIKNKFSETIIYKNLKSYTAGKFWYLFCKGFLLVLTKF